MGLLYYGLLESLDVLDIDAVDRVRLVPEPEHGAGGEGAAGEGTAAERQQQPDGPADGQ